MKNYWNISLLHDQTQKQEIRSLLIVFIDKKHFKKYFTVAWPDLGTWICECFYAMSIHMNHFKKQKSGTEAVSETFKISKFWWNILLWHDQTRTMNLNVWIPSQYTRTILRKKNMWQILFKKHSKFLIFNNVFLLCQHQMWALIIGSFWKYIYAKTTLRK